jgi:hypothetical protein
MVFPLSLTFPDDGLQMDYGVTSLLIIGEKAQVFMIGDFD